MGVGKLIVFSARALLCIGKPFQTRLEPVIEQTCMHRRFILSLVRIIFYRYLLIILYSYIHIAIFSFQNYKKVPNQ